MKKMPPMERQRFLTQFQGMEDLAQHAVDSFLENLPALTQTIELAIQKQDPLKLELAAHTLKGVVSNFFAEPARLHAWQLEQLGHERVLDKADTVFKDLKLELERLVAALSEFSQGKLSA